MNETVRRVTSLSLTVLWVCGCAAPSSEVTARLEQTDTDLREEIDSLKRAAQSSYEREVAIAERLRDVEEHAAVLREQVAAQREQLDTLRGSQPVTRKAADLPAEFDVTATYRRAMASYADHHYESALSQFGQILEAAPSSGYADNAQYWIGECYYGMGRFRQALIEFAKVFSYSKTEKADDAQLQMARSHRALGDRDAAHAAFQKLLDEHPASEYVEDARKEINYLGGP